MHQTRHHIDYSDNEEIQLPVPKRVPIIWSDEDDKALAETSSWEIRIWRKLKESYGIEATDIIPPNTTASFLSDRETNNVPVWAVLPARRLTKILKCPIFKVRQCLENHVPSLPERPRDLPIHSDFTKHIKRCAEQNCRELSVALARSIERIPVSENEAILQMKKRALVNAFRRPEDRIADDAQIHEEPNDLESPNMTSDDEPQMQHQEDIGNLEYQSEPMAESPPLRQSTQSRTRFAARACSSESLPNTKEIEAKKIFEYPPHSATHRQSSENSAQHQSETEGSGHQPSPATLNKAFDNLSVRHGRGLPKAEARNRMMKPLSPQRGPSSGRRLSKQNPLVLAEVIVISSDDEHPTQKGSNGAGPRKGKSLPETTRTRSSEHSAQVRPKTEFEAEPITNNWSGLCLGSRRRTEDYGLEGEEVAIYPMTRTRLSDSPILSQGRPSHRTKLSSYSMQLRTGWEDPDIEDEDSQPEVTMRDSAQSRNHSINRVEESHPELNDWDSLYDDDAEENKEPTASKTGEHAHLQNVGFRDSKQIGRTNQVDHKEDRTKQRFEGGSQGDIGQPTTKGVLS
ncbi:hypothetical protein BTUL_0013g00440 [Botrytis tulipae]|uniref:Uncharacterized protein n=1 Tax=Botrytis tulipae TaxID=87230 RepID=A0A4Z1F8Z1_9HELO|nr:hypothetical protein BTUL_0013g00440 [Botrytis tulipae]